jgi:hypothetical protein
VIVSLHVATGAAAGALARSRRSAILLGLATHAAGDRVPHHDIANRSFELVSGLAGVAALVARFGAFDKVTLGAISGSIPDVEHVVRLPRPGGHKLFPSHRIHGWHHAGGLRTSTQLLLAGFVLGLVLGPRGS